MIQSGSAFPRSQPTPTPAPLPSAPAHLCGLPCILAPGKPPEVGPVSGLTLLEVLLLQSLVLPISVASLSHILPLEEMKSSGFNHGCSSSCFFLAPSAGILPSTWIRRTQNWGLCFGRGTLRPFPFLHFCFTAYRFFFTCCGFEVGTKRRILDSCRISSSLAAQLGLLPGGGG